MHLGKQWAMTQVHRAPVPTWETWMKCLPPGPALAMAATWAVNQWLEVLSILSLSLSLFSLSLGWYNSDFQQKQICRTMVWGGYCGVVALVAA